MRWSLGAIALVALWLAGCGSDGNSQERAQPSPSVTAAPQTAASRYRSALAPELATLTEQRDGTRAAAAAGRMGDAQARARVEAAATRFSAALMTVQRLTPPSCLREAHETLLRAAASYVEWARRVSVALASQGTTNAAMQEFYAQADQELQRADMTRDQAMSLLDMGEC
jgi:outer membrane murein-binding lipoprotein Lpp